MSWHTARLASLVVAIPLLVGLLAGASFEMARRRGAAREVHASPANASARHARPAASVDELWDRMARRVALDRLTAPLP